MINDSHASTPFPYEVLDNEELAPDPIKQAAEYLGLILEFITAGKDAEDLRTRSLVMVYSIKPELLGVDTLEDLVAFSGRKITFQALHKIQKEFTTLTGFKPITSNNNMTKR